MSRPGDRPLRRLPQLASRKATLERCVFCPKLCRSACPVSNAEPRETLIPWGKMSMAYFVGNDSVPFEASYAAPAWACTGCFACRESCDQQKDVTGTLLVDRGGMMAGGLGPAAAVRAVERFERHAEAHRARVKAALPQVASRQGLLVGCAYHRSGAEVAAEAHRVARAVTAGEIAAVSSCCGLPL